MDERKKSILKLTSKILILLILFIIIVSDYDALKTLDVRSLIDGNENLFIAGIIIIGVYCLKSVLFVIPAMLIYTSVGMVFSPVQAIIINLIGIFAEVTLTYLLGMFLGGDYVKNLLSKNKGGRKILEKNIENKFVPLLIVRALPVFPIDFLSLFLGSMKSNFLNYIICSVVGIAPRVILFTILGESIYEYIPMKLIIKIILCIIPVAIVAFVIKYLVGKRKKNSEPEVIEGETNE